MTKILLNVKTDAEVKAKAKRLAKELGIPLSTVVNAYLKEFIRSGEVRFTREPVLRPEVAKLLKQASEDYRKGKNISGPFRNAKDALAYLKK